MVSKPLLKKITQIGIVVKDCKATAKRYWDDFGIGPWKFYTLDPSNTPNMTLRGQPVKHAFLAALAKVGEVELELIEPLDDRSLYSEHLAIRGEGLHHVAFDVERFDQLRIHLQEIGYNEIQGGRPFDIVEYAYFDTDKTLACVAELGTGVDDGKTFPKPEFTYP